MKRILIDDTKCLSCHSCELACAVAHSQSKSLFAAIAESPVPTSRVYVEQSGRGSFPIQCRHCQDAHCVSVCPTKALYKDGIVTAHDEKRCIGCFMCAIACPFGVIEETENPSTVSKCDLCISNNSQPACIKACPTGVLSFEDVEGFSKSKRKEYLSTLSASN